MIQDPQAPEFNFVGMPPAPTPLRSRRNITLVISCVIVLVVALGAMLTILLLRSSATASSNPGGGKTPSTPGTNPGGGSVTVAQGTAVVSQYNAHINAGDYRDAYQGYYIVGTENNNWQLFSASIH